MVTDLLIGVLHDVVMWLLDLLPTFTLPSWMSQNTGAVGTVLTYANSMGAWFPSGLAVAAALSVLAAYAIGFGIKVARIVASFATLGGGSAA